MPRYKVEINWEWSGEADDEGDALDQADRNFSVYRDARATNVFDEWGGMVDDPKSE